ncbi:LAMI_0H02212g1_1 [Lachancea mirantina]|uniref:2-dehydropantoate 2-reductase n=1 Tax=Lachancea mirantina TaxID=1230905 RepID=A0A1G4KE22_9SACH|nr:LAMI_0H02212g1_1 [Lachancea mirantina]
MASSKPTIFVLGFGSIGAMLASHLQQQTQALIVPLFRSEKRLHDFQENQNAVAVTSLFKESQECVKSVFDRAICPERIPDGCKIDNLIVTTKTYQTKEAISPLLKYLHAGTNVILIQNGLGVFETVTEEVFTTFRPQLFQGVISHGIFQDKPFSFKHAGFGDLKIARLPIDEVHGVVQSLDEVAQDAAKNMLVRALTNPNFVTSMNVKHLTYQELLLSQLEKFLVNACINPITSIVDCINGELEHIARPIFDAIITEALEILKVAYKPLFEYNATGPGYPKLDVHGILERKRLLDFIIRIGCVVNGNNSSSMRQDTLNLRDTEVEYINGYIVRLAKSLGLPASTFKTNQTVETLVNLRLGLNRLRSHKV